jgi:hypothetical protein
MGRFKEYRSTLRYRWKEGRIIRELVNRYGFDMKTARCLCGIKDIPFTIRHTNSTPEQLASDINHFFADGLLKPENQC